MRSLAGELVALSLHCFTDGQASLERVVRDRLAVLTEDVGELIRNWTVNSALGHLRSFLTGVQAGPAQVSINQVEKGWASGWSPSELISHVFLLSQLCTACCAG